MPLNLTIPPDLLQQYLDSPQPITDAKKNRPQAIDPKALAVFLGGAGADIGSTAVALNHGLQEANPLINKLPTAAMLPVGAAMEGGAMYLASKLLKNHPKIMNALLVGAGATHGGLAINNVRQIKGKP